MSTFNADAASYLQENFLVEGEQGLHQYHQRMIQGAIAADPSPKDLLPDQFRFALSSGFAYLGKARGSINLTSFVRDAMTEKATFDHFAVAGVVQPAMRFLDDMALKEKAELSLSVDGLAETLMLIGVDYRSYSGRRIAAGIMRTIRDECFDAAIRLTVERGPNPSLNVEQYLSEGYGKTLPSDFKDDIRRFGLRYKTILNVSSSAVAPVVFYNGVSPGFLPPPNWMYTWTLQNSVGRVWYIKTTNPVYALLGEGVENLHAHCKTALDLDVEDYHQMVEAVVKFVDGIVENPETFYTNQLNRTLSNVAYPANSGPVANDAGQLQRVWNTITGGRWATA